MRRLLSVLADWFTTAPLDLGLREPVPAAEVEAIVERVKVRECRSDSPVLYDQEAPLASEVEAWLAGGAR